MKKCNKCNIEKDENEFRKTRNECKECEKNFRIKYKEKNKDKIKDYMKDYFKSYQKKNEDDLKKYRKEYYVINSDKIKKYQKENYKNNKEEIIKQQNLYNKNRKKTNYFYRIKCLISNSIYLALKRNNSSKAGKSVLKYLSYTMQELKQHIESQFEQWMNWDNQGIYNEKTWNDSDQTTWTWQIDHIIPQSTFNYTSMEDQAFKDCWSLDNLRPLSAKQNLLDGVNRVRHSNHDNSKTGSIQQKV